MFSSVDIQDKIKTMANRDKKRRHDSGLTVGDMNELAVLLLEAFKGSIQLELDETGQVNPRLLSEAVRWLKDSGVTLNPDSAQVGDFAALAKALDGLYEADEERHTYI